MAADTDADSIGTQVEALVAANLSPQAIILTLAIQNDLTIEEAVAAAARADAGNAGAYRAAATAARASYSRVVAAVQGRRNTGPGQSGDSTSGGGGGNSVAEAVQQVLDGTDN